VNSFTAAPPKIKLKIEPFGNLFQNRLLTLSFPGFPALPTGQLVTVVTMH